MQRRPVIRGYIYGLSLKNVLKEKISDIVVWNVPLMKFMRVGEVRDHSVKVLEYAVS